MWQERPKGVARVFGPDFAPPAETKQPSAFSRLRSIFEQEAPHSPTADEGEHEHSSIGVWHLASQEEGESQSAVPPPPIPPRLAMEQQLRIDENRKAAAAKRRA